MVSLAGGASMTLALAILFIPAVLLELCRISK